MENITYKKRISTNDVKSGFVRGYQRYKCKDCGYNFKFGDNRGKVRPEVKSLALLMYCSVKASYGMISRLFNVNRSTVLYWIRTMGCQIPEPAC